MSVAIAIHASDLSYRYPKSDYLSLDQVSLSIKQGCCTGLIGPNGAGKSTLISTLTGLLSPLSGEVVYPQYEASELSEVIREQVALVPQDFAFYQQLSVQENLNYFAGLTRIARSQRQQVIEQVLVDCQLAALAKRPAKALSGGNKRKLNLAIALLKDPQVIFLDEPTVGVDPISRQAIVDLIKQLNEQGKTLIYTSHLLNEVQSICDDVFVMQEGKISQFEPHQNKQLILKAAQLCPALLEQLSDQGEVVHYCEQELLFEPKDEAALQQTLTLIAQAHLQIESLTYQPHSLSQFYHETFK